MSRLSRYGLRNKIAYARPTLVEPTDEELLRATQAVHFEAGKSNDPKVQQDTEDPAFWRYSERYALAALMSYLNPDA